MSFSRRNWTLYYWYISKYRNGPKGTPMLSRVLLFFFSTTTFAGSALGATPFVKTDSATVPGMARVDASSNEAVTDTDARPSVVEDTISTRHSISLDGKVFTYQATAGTLTIRDAQDKPTASLFYVAYTRPPSAPRLRRPVTFLYNGGPLSASMWLHLGSFAPVRLTTDKPNSLGAPPYHLDGNPDTLLNKTDLVFIDAVGVGYSRVLSGSKPADFQGVDQDVDAYTKAITRYLTKFDRWNDPRYLIGESYGTTRSAALAYRLQEKGAALNGVILMSSILDFGLDNSENDIQFIGSLPTYAAIAWYHGKGRFAADKLPDVVSKATQFANGAYASALAKGQDITDNELATIAATMSEFTGLSLDYLKRSYLRIDEGSFSKELLRDQGKMIGRLDGRYTKDVAGLMAARSESDPTEDAITSGYVSEFQNYISSVLGYRSPLAYRIFLSDGGPHSWDWTHAPLGGGGEKQMAPNVSGDLAAAIVGNPTLQVDVLNGYFDLATPFNETAYTLRHMMLNRADQKRIRVGYFESGHMIYLSPQALHAMKSQLSEFYDDTSN